jgi:hypothetical protein
MAMTRGLAQGVVMDVVAFVVVDVFVFLRASRGMRMRSACHLCLVVAPMGVRVRTMFMAVVPKFGFVEQKEKY